MESGDTSNEEAPPSNPRKKDLSRNEWLEAISVLVMMAMEDGLQQVLVMDIPKRFNMSCSMIYRLWECTECMHATGVINSPELVLQKNFQEST